MEGGYGEEGTNEGMRACEAPEDEGEWGVVGGGGGGGGVLRVGGGCHLEW